MSTLSETGAGGRNRFNLRAYLAGGAVDNVENTTDQVVDVPLGEATDGVTQPVDEAVGGALNEVGGAVGQPDLGDQVGGAVDGATDQVGGAVNGLVP